MLRLRVFRTMGRLTFGAYLIHPSVIRLSYGSMRHPFFTDDFRVVIDMRFFLFKFQSFHIDTLFHLLLFCPQYDSTMSAFVTSYALSFVVCMTVEMPFSIIQKLIFNKNVRPTEKTIYETTETEAIKLSKKLAETEAKTTKSFS